MAKYSISGDEWYPVLTLENVTDDKAFEFTDAEIADIRRVGADFDRIQQMLAERGGYLQSFLEWMGPGGSLIPDDKGDGE